MAVFLRIATTAVMLLAMTLAAVPLTLTLSLTGADSRTAPSALADATPLQTPTPVSVRPVMLATPAPVSLRSVTLPAPTPASPRSVTLPRLASPQPLPSTHTVVSGETLWGISQAAGVEVGALAEANHMSEEDTLRLGQVLTVPPPGTRASARYVGARSAIPHLIWPYYGRITSRFGWRIHPIFGTREFHTGIDIAAGTGAPVRAAESGVVRFAGWSGGYGRLIILDHGHGLQTSYSHLSAILVAPGDRVEAGQVVGRIGSTGWSTGPHLLFEVRRDGVPLDPNRFLH